MKKILINLKDYFNMEMNSKFESVIEDIPLVVFPSLPYLYIYKDMRVAEVGVQRICTYESGAHTGSVSNEHLEDFNVKWTLINHKEARHYDKVELDDKVTVSLNNDLNTVVCFKDNEELDLILDIISDIDNKSKLYLAYEPIDSKDVNSLVSEIESFKLKLNGISLIYGGNVSSNNISDFNDKLDVDGFLISRHALDINELKNIISLLNR